MKSIIDTSEILGTVALQNGEAEVCASAEASHASGKVAVRLDAFLRPIHVHGKEERLAADWLPRPETITESVFAWHDLDGRLVAGPAHVSLEDAPPPVRS